MMFVRVWLQPQGRKKCFSHGHSELIYELKNHESNQFILGYPDKKNRLNRLTIFFN